MQEHNWIWTWAWSEALGKGREKAQRLAEKLDELKSGNSQRNSFWKSHWDSLKTSFHEILWSSLRVIFQYFSFLLPSPPFFFHKCLSSVAPPLLISQKRTCSIFTLSCSDLEKLTKSWNVLNYEKVGAETFSSGYRYLKFLFQFVVIFAKKSFSRSQIFFFIFALWNFLFQT